MLDNVFLFCLLLGLVFSAASFFLGLTGSVLPHLHLGSLTHAGHTIHVAHQTHAIHLPHAGHAAHATTPTNAAAERLDGLPFLSISALLAFLTAFGGVGYIVDHFTPLPTLVALAAAILAGCAGDVLIAAFLSMLIRGEHVLDPSEFRLEGVVAKVSVSIGENGVGEIIYSLQGRRWSDAARSTNGKPVSKGAKVVILRFEKGIAYVQPWNDFVAAAAPELMEEKE